MSKDIILKQFNGTSYDELHPKTNIAQALSSQEINEYYGLASDATFSDVLKAIPEDVGTIKYSVKSLSQMGDKYLLCDGSSIDGDKYSELAAYLEKKYYPTKETDFTAHNVTLNLSFMPASYTSVKFDFKEINYINGYYICRIVATVTTSSGSAKYYRILYSKSLDEPFVDVPDIEPVHLFYCNGQIIAATTTTNSSKYVTAFTCKVATDPSGTWIDGPTFTAKQLYNTTDYYYFTNIGKVLYDGERYLFPCIVRQEDSSIKYISIFACSELTSTSESDIAVGVTTTSYTGGSGSGIYNENIAGFQYINGYYIILHTSTTFVYSTSWNNTYSEVTFSATSRPPYCIYYYDSKWFLCCQNYLITSTNESLTSFSSSSTATSISFCYSDDYPVTFSKLDNGTTIIVGEEGRDFSTGPTFDILVCDGIAPTVINLPIIGSDTASGAGAYGSFFCIANFSNQTEGIWYIFKTAHFLPVIPSILTANAYIKALPGK